MSLRCAQKLARLSAIVAERGAWEKQLMQIKRLRQWVLSTEHILSGRWAQVGDVISNATVGERLDAWRHELAKQGTDGTLAELEQECLTAFLQVLSNQRSHLVQCYDREGFPRTNNDMERSIRSLKTQYRRVSGRKNWNSYLLRYGRSIASAAWWEQDAAHHQQLEHHVVRLDRTRWRVFRRETKAAETRTAQTLSFPPQASAVPGFAGGSLGYRCFDVTFALTEKKPSEQRIRGRK